MLQPFRRSDGMANKRVEMRTCRSVLLFGLVVGASVLATSSAAAAQSLSVRVLTANGVGVRVVKVTVPQSVERVKVTWGDHTSSTIAHACGKLTARKAVSLFAPHRYGLAGSFHVTANPVQRCGGVVFRRAVAAEASTQVSTGNAGTPPNVTANPQNSQWTSFDQAPSLANASYTTVAATPLPGGGCNIGGGWQRMPADGPASSETAEVAIDISTCSVLTETGTPSDSVISQTFAPSTWSSGVTAGSSKPTATSGMATAAYTVYRPGRVRCAMA